MEAILVFIGCLKSTGSQLDITYIISGFQAIAFTSNILHMVQCKSSYCCGCHVVFLRIPQMNSVRGITGIDMWSQSDKSFSSYRVHKQYPA